MTTPARPCIPGQTLHITARAVGRTYRFCPRKEVVELIRYCMAAALEGHDIEVHEFCWMGNHWHLVVTDYGGSISKYINKVHSMVSRNLNAMRGHKGANFEKDLDIKVQCDEVSVFNACVYALANPARAGLVANIRHWKGAHSGHLQYGKEIVIRKPRVGMWKSAPRATSKRGKKVDETRAKFFGRQVTPNEVRLTLERPPIMEDTHSDEELRAEILKRVAQIEEEVAHARQVQGRRPMGMKRVRAMRWWEMPGTGEELFVKRGRAAAGTREAVKLYERWWRGFQLAYRAARDAWSAGMREVEFPYGTLMMRERFGVCVAAAPPE